MSVGYNGWKNWDTWALYLNLSNDPDLWNSSRRRAKGYARDFKKWVMEIKPSLCDGSAIVGSKVCWKEVRKALSED